MLKYRDITTAAPDYQPMEYYSMADEEQDLSEWLAGRQAGDGENAGVGCGATIGGAQIIDLPTGTTDGSIG